MEQNPVIGLPKAVAVALDALLAENKLTSWNISGGNKNVTLKLRFTSGHDHDNCQPFQQTFRSKPPLAVARDKARMGKWMREKDSRGESGFYSSMNLDNFEDTYMFKVDDSSSHANRQPLHASPRTVSADDYQSMTIGASVFSQHEHEQFSGDMSDPQHVSSSPDTKPVITSHTPSQAPAMSVDSPSLKDIKSDCVASTPANQKEKSTDNINDNCDICSRHEDHDTIYRLLQNKPRVLARCKQCKGVLARSSEEYWEEDFVRPVYKCTSCTDPDNMWDSKTIWCKTCMLKHVCDGNGRKKYLKLSYHNGNVAVIAQ